MKLHDLQPAEGSRKARTRVGRGIAAGKGKTAGRGTKGQKARAGGSIPPWFEGGQTPLHMRIPKLRGFTNRFKVQYEVVNVGAINALAERGAFDKDETAGKPSKSSKSAPITVNQDILRAVGLVRTLNKPLKILGAGDLSVALFVVADAFTASAREKIEAAGGVVNVLEVPTTAMPALGVDQDRDEATAEAATRAPATGQAGTADDTATTNEAGSTADTADDTATTDEADATQATDDAATTADAQASDAAQATDEIAGDGGDGGPTGGTPASDETDGPGAVVDTDDQEGSAEAEPTDAPSGDA